MKNILIALVTCLVILIAGNTVALDLILSLPDANVPRVIAAVLAVHPNNECADWDLATVLCLTKKYTDEEWVREVARRLLVDGIKRAERGLLDKAMAAKQAAIIKTEEEKIIPPTLDDYQLTIK